jgi:hypothetical protein
LKKILESKVLAVLTAALFLLIAVALVANESRKRTAQVSLSAQGEMTVTLPNGFQSEKDPLSGLGENIFLYNFSGIVQKGNHGNTLAVPVSGYIRTAFLQKPLHQYLNESEQYRSAAIYDLKRTTVIADGVQGYQWKYKIKKDDGKFIIVNDAFFSGIDKFYTLHFSAVADNKNSAESSLIQGALDAVYEETLNSIIFEDSVQSGKLLEWYS